MQMPEAGEPGVYLEDQQGSTRTEEHLKFGEEVKRMRGRGLQIATAS